MSFLNGMPSKVIAALFKAFVAVLVRTPGIPGLTCRGRVGRTDPNPGYHGLPKPSFLQVLITKPYIEFIGNLQKDGFG